MKRVKSLLISWEALLVLLLLIGATVEVVAVDRGPHDHASHAVASGIHNMSLDVLRA